MTNQMPENGQSNEAAPLIDGYRVLAKLGSGATSSIWKAEQVSLNRPVVIKALSEQLSHEPEDVTLFKAEAHLAANLKHPNIVQVYDFGQSKKNRCYYFVMEYISGYSVGDWIRRSGKIAEADALIIVQSVAMALKYAWNLSKIVHRDIKPDNIMVDGDGSIKVADLGVAHAVKTIGLPLKENVPQIAIAGTPNYMAPEQIRGTDNIDCRADIYALGASLFHIVTGQLPFGEGSADVVLQRRLQEQLEYPQKVNPNLSTGVTRLIVKMTSREPAARFQTWDEVLAEVVRLERQMRSQSQPVPAAPSSAAAAGADRAAARPPPAESKKAGPMVGADLASAKPPAEPGRPCRHCGKPVQAQASYCAFCGQPLTAAAAESLRDQRRLTIRLKPIKTARPPTSTPSAATLPGPLRHERGTWGGWFRMVIALLLLAFLSYCAYQKVRYNRNVLIPVKAAILRIGQELLTRAHLLVAPEQAPTAAETTAPATEETAAPEQMTAPEEPTPVPAEAPPAEASAAQAETAPEAESAATPAPEPVTTEAAATKPAELAEDATTAKAAPEAKYERILEKCKKQEPRAGNRITIRFKDGRAPVEGLFQEKTAAGVMIKVAAGVLEYPFRLMTEETRLLYFPEERAQRLQQKAVEKHE